MNPNFIDDLEIPLTCNWNGSSSHASQPPASLETRLQNLSLTAPVSVPEVSSLNEDSSPCPQYLLYWHMQNQIQAPQSRRRKPEKVPFYFNFRREQLRQAKERAIARISQNGMGSTSSMSSFPGANHKVNGGEDAAVGATCSISTGTVQERNGGGDHLYLFMLFCYPHGNGVFQQNNFTSHKSRLATGWLDKHSSDFSVINWPPKSPDVYPIEHI
ncbi:DDE_3 domain-containing protein [Trichonephila clavipes]|nr:DDE_3 domain-containing protein [Trichonephila clavipes]